MPMGFVQRIGLFFYNLFYNFFEFVFFFTHYWWWKLTVLRAVYYIRESSYKIFQREKSQLEGMSEENFIYGETGVLTAKLLLQEVKLEKGALIYDLGCGRGTFLFAANFLFDLRGVGVELFTPYIIYGKKLKKALKVAGINFVNKNFLEVDFSPADIVYVAGTTFDKQTREILQEKFRDLQQEAVVISVHHKLDEEDFILFYQGKFPFSWGTDEVFFYRRK